MIDVIVIEWKLSSINQRKQCIGNMKCAEFSYGPFKDYDVLVILCSMNLNTANVQCTLNAV